MEILEMEEQLRHKDKLKADLMKLQRQKEALREEIKALEAVKESEFKDVESLDQGGLSNLFCRITGKIEQKRIKEEQEAISAADAYDEAVGRLRVLNEKIHGSWNTVLPKHWRLAGRRSGLKP